MTQFNFDRVEEVFDSRILDYRQTLEELAKPDVSLARFGDSEIKMLSSSFSIGFQKFSTDLQSDLREIAKNTSDNLLVGFPPVFRNDQWSALWEKYFDSTEDYFRSTTRFANTAVSRPPCFNELKEDALIGWRNIWDGKSLTVVTGQGGRFDYYPELFDNAASFDTLYSKSVDAYEHLDDICNTISASKKSDIYLLSLGPAATVLASRLSAQGYKALDVGHLSASFAYWRGTGLYPEKMEIDRS